MFSALKDWWRQRIIRRSRIPDAGWEDAFASLPLLGRLADAERRRLRELAILFLHQKRFFGTHGLEISDEMRVSIALQACLPILNLGIDWYRGWTSIIVYPGGFVPEHVIVDEDGLEHRVREPLSGEAWEHGPVILSWEDSDGGAAIDGGNVVIHEFVHKLDMLNGPADGFPPLHADMNPAHWTEIFTTAFEDFQDKVDAGEITDIHHYAASEAPEFVAVLSEVFFEQPQIIFREYPEVYTLLSAFFRQDPLNAGGSLR
jgi:Mlc titration factor MtfA (ptsG expression regulator)